MKQKAKDLAQKALMALKSLKVTFNLEDGSFSAGLGDVDAEFQSLRSLSDELTDVFLALGNAAMKSEDTICFFIDEMQYLKKEELEVLVNAIHRVNQKRLPMMIFGAGLPMIVMQVR